MDFWQPWLRFAVAVLAALAAAVVLTLLVTLLVRTFARRRDWPGQNCSSSGSEISSGVVMEDATLSRR